MGKLTRVLTAVMLGLFSLLLLAALLLGTLGRLPHKSYAAALLPALALFVLWRRRRGEMSLWRRLGPVRTGALLCLVCLTLDLVWVLAFRLAPEGDYATFWATALALSRGQRPDTAAYVALFPHILGYAQALGVFLRLSGGAAMTAPLLNAALSALSCLVIFVLCLRWRGLDAAAFAALLWAVCPSKVLYNTMVLSEPWYSCLLLLALLAVSGLERRAGADRPGLPVFALGGIALGLLLRLVNSARPIAAVPLIALGLWLLLLGGLGRGRRAAAWGLCLALLLGAYLAAGRLWTDYAARVLGQPPADTPGYSLYVGLNLDSGGSYSNEDGALVIETAERLGSARAAQTEMLRLARERFSAMGAGELAGLLPVKLRSFMGNDEGGAFYSRSALSARGYAALAFGSNVYYYLLLLLALAGARRLWRERESGPVLLAPLYVLGLTLAQMLVEVSGRYHYSLLPMLAILAAWTVSPGNKEDKS